MWWGVVVLAVVAAVVAWGAWRVRGLARAALAVAAVCALVVAGVLGRGTASGYVPDARALVLLGKARLPLPAALAAHVPARPPHAASARHGVTWRVRVGSAADGVGDRYAWVHVPPGFRDDGSVRYPVVYLLSGSPGTGTDWLSAGQVDASVDRLVDQRALAPLIVVSPDLGLGQDQEPVDRPGGPQLGTFVVRDVVAWADDHLPTRPDAADRVLGGMSAGAYGALVAGVRRPDVFGAVVALLPYTTAADRGLRAHPTAQTSPLPAIAASGAPAVPVYLLGASRDPDAADACTLGRRLAATGHDVAAAVVPGDHDWRFARVHLAAGLRWAFAHLGAASDPESGVADVDLSGCSAG